MKLQFFGHFFSFSRKFDFKSTKVGKSILIVENFQGYFRILHKIWPQKQSEKEEFQEKSMHLPSPSSMVMLLLRVGAQCYRLFIHINNFLYLIGNIILPTNSYFNVKLFITSTQLCLDDDDNNDVKIVLQKSLINNVRYRGGAEFLTVYVLSVSI